MAIAIVGSSNMSTPRNLNYDHWQIRQVVIGQQNFCIPNVITVKFILD